MYSKVYSVALQGLEGRLVEVETDIRDGLPAMEMVGALGTEVKEARERVRTAIANSDYKLPPKKITINLSPSHIRKAGNSFDLPIAISMLMALDLVPEEGIERCLFAGELGLNGSVRPVRGVLPMALFAREQGISRFVLSHENREEAKLVDGIEVFGVRSLAEAVDMLNWCAQREVEQGVAKKTPRKVEISQEEEGSEEGGLPDGDERRITDNFSELIGQLAVRRAAEVAVSGYHNLLMVGPPGSGKTMVARRMAGILPVLTKKESLEVSRIYSVCGLLTQERPVIRERPFRAPHHTVTTVALTGGGRSLKPGEISLADHGVLFLDELTEFRRETLDVLRQPLEEGEILLSRASGSCSYPAGFMLVAGMNPCPCGYFPDRSRCRCTTETIRRYLGHVSRPLLDRIDLSVEAAALPFQQLVAGGQAESSETIRKRVILAHQIQAERFCGCQYQYNSRIPASEIGRFCALGAAETAMMEQVYEKMHLSARGYHKILKVARTIADMEGKERIGRSHLSEAVGYRSVEARFWGKVEQEV